MNDKQKDLLREFSKEGSEKQRPHESSWFDKVKKVRRFDERLTFFKSISCSREKANDKSSCLRFGRENGKRLIKGIAESTSLVLCCD